VYSVCMYVCVFLSSVFWLQSVGKQWVHPSESLTTGRVVYTVKVVYHRLCIILDTFLLEYGLTAREIHNTEHLNHEIL